MVEPEVLTRVRRPVRLPLVHNARDPGQKRTVANVGMTNNPAHVGGRPPHRLVVTSVNGFHGPTKRDDVATDGSLNPFRLVCNR